MLAEDTRLLVREVGEFITHSSGGRHCLYYTGHKACLPFALKGAIPLPPEAALYTNILEKVVQNKKPSEPTSAQRRAET